MAILPLWVAGVFAVVLTFSIRGITAALAWNADFVSPMVMAESLGTAHGPKEVIFGTYAPLTTLWLNLAVRHLPAHHALWKLTPLVVTTLGLMALGWAVWRVAGRWAAMLVIAIGFAGSTPVLTTLLAQANHGFAYSVMCVLAAFLVFVATRPMTPIVVTSAALLGIVAGLNIASDPLLLLVGIAPFFGAALLVSIARRGRDMRRLLPLTVGVTALSLAVAGVTSRVAESAGYSVLGVSQGNPLSPATRSQMWSNLRRTVDNLLLVFNADFRGPFGPATPFRIVLAALTLLSLCIAVALLIRCLASRKPSPTQRATDDSALMLLEAYWGLVVTGLIVGLVFTRLAAVNAPRAIAYTTPLFLAVAATVPVIARRSLGRRAIAGAGAALFCGFSVLSLMQREIPRAYQLAGFVRDGDQVLRLLEQEGLHRGYASYGSASPLTFRSGSRVKVLPVIPCTADASRFTLCPFPANRVRAWYEPKAGPSFVIADPSLPWPVTAPPPPELGVPSRVLTAGSQTVFVYPFDVAARFGPTG